ncbi:hypothetical protein HPB47_016002 [Ixodes persulcatus]|uniref:Uncharacterized protein n=1 Tax=Ixodes persulcatus TaxID=34615 RepID=A0AC60QUK9_IXOPE|nr:hypothetical protein HPB47_016002 [Ixodes persulcatus]
MHPASPPQPTKTLTFDVSCPPGASVDSIFDAATGILGTAELFSVQHLGATNFQLSVTSSSAMSRIVIAGSLSIGGTLVPIVPRSTRHFPHTLREGPGIRFGVYQDHPTLRTGMRYIRMKMKDSTPVANFLRVSGHRATFDYRGLRRACGRCQREGHIKAACSMPYCTRCAAFGHDSAGCATGCGRCGAAHATMDCTQRCTYLSVAGQRLNEFAALASTPRDGPPATPSPAASNAPAPSPAVGPTESTVPSPSESTETTSPELDSTTPQPTPATAMATGEDLNAPVAMLRNAPPTAIFNDAKISVPLPTSSRSEEAPVQLESLTAPEFQATSRRAGTRNALSSTRPPGTPPKEWKPVQDRVTENDAATQSWGAMLRFLDSQETREREVTSTTQQMQIGFSWESKKRNIAPLEPRRLRSRSRSRHGVAEEGKRVLSSSDEFVTPQDIPPAAARLKPPAASHPPKHPRINEEPVTPFPALRTATDPHPECPGVPQCDQTG